MLSYRHAFHAGNHADVLKHFVLDQVLTYITQKDKAFWYIDSHAGAGQYALDTHYAAQNTEFDTGITRLRQTSQLPAPLQQYVDLIARCNPGPALRIYPGSPEIAHQHLRSLDKMRLFELHPTDYRLLVNHYSQQQQQIKVMQQDGFAGLKAILPPPSKRAVVLIDPPYEEKQDYQRVVSAVKDSMNRFATGTYLIWYPLLPRAEPLAMVQSLQQLGLNNWLNVAIQVQQPSPDGFGMYGSGLYIVNPPWTLPAILEQSLPVLVNVLAQDASAHHLLEFSIS